MTWALGLQGRLFCAVACALVVASLAGARLSPHDELLAVGLLVLLLGMPHGALDVLIARQLFGTANVWGWTFFCVSYLGLAAAVVGVWIVAPTLFLGLFLTGSALHFAGDPAAGASRLARIGYGGAVIVLPALWHGAELQRLLGLVAGPESAELVTPVLSHLAWPWLAAMVLACAGQFRTNGLAACESAGLAALALAAPPLVAFSAYFCVMHSPRHVIRTCAGLDSAEVRKAWAMALYPTLAVVIAAALLFWLVDGVTLEARVMQILFVGLAALTLPHMALLEHARWAAAAAHR